MAKSRISLSYYKYLITTISKRVSTWVYISLYVLLFFLIFFVAPNTLEITFLDLWNDTSLLIQQLFIYFCAIITSLFAITIFKESWENGSDLIISSKPLKRDKLILIKYYAFSTYIGIISLVAALLSFTLLFTNSFSASTMFSIFFSILISNVLIFFLVGMIALLVAIWTTKVWSILITISFTFFITFYNLISIIIFPPTIVNLERNGYYVYNTNNFEYNDGEEKYVASLIPKINTFSTQEETLEFINQMVQLGVDEYQEIYKNNSSKNNPYLNFLLQFNLLNNLFDLNIKNVNDQYDNFGSGTMVNYKINDLAFKDVSDLPYVIPIINNLSFNVNKGFVDSDGNILPSIVQDFISYIYNICSNNVVFHGIKKTNEYTLRNIVGKKNQAINYTWGIEDLTNNEKIIFAKLFDSLVNEEGCNIFDDQIYSGTTDLVKPYKFENGIISFTSNSSFNKPNNIIFPFNSDATNLSDFLHYFFTSRKTPKQLFNITDDSEINSNLAIIDLLNISNNYSEQEVLAKFSLYVIEQASVEFYDNESFAFLSNHTTFSSTLSNLNFTYFNPIKLDSIDITMLNNNAVFFPIINDFLANNEINSIYFHEIFMDKRFRHLISISNYLDFVFNQNAFKLYSSTDPYNYNKADNVESRFFLHTDDYLTSYQLQKSFNYSPYKSIYISGFLSAWFITSLTLAGITFVIYRKVDFS